MDKDNNKNQLSIPSDKSFPTLRKSQSVAKNFITLSKVQLQKNSGIPAEQYQVPKNYRESISGSTHKRTNSGLNLRQLIQPQMSKTYRNFIDLIPQKQSKSSIGFIAGKQKSISMNNTTQKQKDKHQQVQAIQKAKISTKSLGQIKAYSVNSHPGIINANNEDRICVITNLNKSFNKAQSISFFCIYDGQNGSNKAQFFRDNFHFILVKDKDFNNDIQTAIKRSITIAEESYKKANIESENTSTTKLLMVIIKDVFLYIASMGQNKMIISSEFGKQIINPLMPPLMKKSASISRVSRNPLRNNGFCIKFKKIQLKHIDFVVLGSEGLFENMNQLKLGRKIWIQILCKTSKNIHLAFGQTANAIMSSVFQYESTKNVSLIMIAFQNAEACFNHCFDVEIPYAFELQADISQQLS